MCAPLARCSTTASTAVPIAPPTRCSTFSCGVASESWSGRSDAKAAVIAGMKEKPMPTPRTSSTAEISTIEVSRADERERDRAEREQRHADERDAPAAEALGQAAGERHHEQHRRAPAGRSSSPVTITLSWRTSW